MLAVFHDQVSYLSDPPHLGRHLLHIRPNMPELFNQMLARWPFQFIEDVERITIKELYCSLMGKITVVADRNGTVLLGSTGKMNQAHFGLIHPSKWSSWDGLIPPVNANRVMGGSTPKGISPVRIHVCVRARIDKDLFPPARHDKGQGVCVTVAGAPRSKGARVEQRRNFTAPHHDESRISKHSGLAVDVWQPDNPALLRTKPP